MQISKTPLVVASLMIVVWVGWGCAEQRAQPHQPGSHVLLSAEDHIEIQQLYGVYTRDVDPGSIPGCLVDVHGRCCGSARPQPLLPKNAGVLATTVPSTAVKCSDT